MLLLPRRATPGSSQRFLLALTQDELVYHEEDEQFYVGIGRSRDDSLLWIHSGAHRGVH